MTERFATAMGAVFMERLSTIEAAEDAAPTQRFRRGSFFVWALPGGGFGWTDDATHPPGELVSSLIAGGDWKRRREKKQTIVTAKAQDAEAVDDRLEDTQDPDPFEGLDLEDDRQQSLF